MIYIHKLKQLISVLNVYKLIIISVTKTPDIHNACPRITSSLRTLPEANLMREFDNCKFLPVWSLKYDYFPARLFIIFYYFFCHMDLRDPQPPGFTMWCLSAV